MPKVSHLGLRPASPRATEAARGLKETEHRCELVLRKALPALELRSRIDDTNGCTRTRTARACAHSATLAHRTTAALVARLRELLANRSSPRAGLLTGGVDSTAAEPKCDHPANASIERWREGCRVSNRDCDNDSLWIVGLTDHARRIDGGRVTGRGCSALRSARKRQRPERPGAIRSLPVRRPRRELSTYRGCHR